MFLCAAWRREADKSAISIGPKETPSATPNSKIYSAKAIR